MDRFLRLEKRRPAAAAPPAALGSPGRFGREPPPEERPLHVLEHEGMPFVRCCVCRTDSHVAARVCPNCRSDLGTAVQRSFNQALAREYARRSAEERAEADAVRSAREQADREAREAQVRAMESLIRMERRHAGIPGQAGDDPPLGLRLARRIRNPRLRLAALVSAAVVPLALVFGGLGAAAVEAGLVLLVLLAALFAPRRWRRLIWED